jgi:hypothetical protein
MTRQVKFPTIASGQLVSAPFSIANAKELALIIPLLNANPGSTMSVQIQAAFVDVGGTTTSNQYLPIQKNDGSGVWQIVTAGSCAVALGSHIIGFDQVRIACSSAMDSHTTFLLSARV